MTIAADATPLSPPMTAVPPHTPEEILALEAEDGLFELVEGRLVEKVMSGLSNLVAGAFTTEFTLWTRQHGGYVMPEQGYQCFVHEPTRVRRPDVSLVLAGRINADALVKGHVMVRPDVVVEVVSPNDLAEELAAKLEDYRLAGIPLVLVAFPSTRSVEARRVGGAVEVLREGDLLTADATLLGFSVRIADLFPPK
jgi:Uma2 family endonuclease